MLQFTFNTGTDVIRQFLETDWVKSVKATKVSVGGFCDMVGYDYTINIKVEGKTISPTQRYKGRMFQILTNSTYMGELMEENNENPLNAFNEYIENMII